VRNYAGSIWEKGMERDIGIKEAKGTEELPDKC